MVLVTAPFGEFANSPKDKFVASKKLGMAPPLSPLLVSLRTIVGDATVSMSPDALPASKTKSTPRESINR